MSQLPEIVDRTSHTIIYRRHGGEYRGEVWQTDDPRPPFQWIGLVRGDGSCFFRSEDAAIRWVEDRLYIRAMCDADNPDRDLDDHQLVRNLQEVA